MFFMFSFFFDRLTKLKISKEAHEGALSRMEADLKLVEEELVEARAAKPALSSRFILYQNLRGYVTDLVDCLRCKVHTMTSSVIIISLKPPMLIFQFCGLNSCISV